MTTKLNQVRIKNMQQGEFDTTMFEHVVKYTISQKIRFLFWKIKHNIKSKWSSFYYGFPMIITLENLKSIPLHNVEVLKPASYLKSKVIDSDYSIKSGIPNVSVADMLFNMAINKPRIRRIVIFSKSIIQIQSVFTLCDRKVCGSYSGKPFVPIIDSYQSQSEQIIIKTKFNADFMTSFVVADLYPNCEVTIQFWKR